MVRLVEVGPRDGLQNEPDIVPIADRVRLIESLVSSGLRAIECGSFVSYQSVPTMAGSADVFKAINRKPGVDYTALTPNLRGFEEAFEAGASQVAVFASASETFSQRNINCSIEQSLARYREVCDVAKGAKIPVRGYISCVVGCPYEGAIPPATVRRVAEELLNLGCYEISLGDTTGVGTPGDVRSLLSELLKSLRAEKFAVHFHDTWGQALANILAALEMGISVVDAAVAGLGGCPHAPGASGNVATEDVVYMLNGMHIETGVDFDKLARTGLDICRVLNREPASKALRAWAAKQE